MRCLSRAGTSPRTNRVASNGHRMIEHRFTARTQEDRTMKAVACACLAAVLTVALSAAAQAQEPKSAALAKQLAAALDAAKLDCIAAKDPSAPDVFIAALYFPGVQLLVVSGKYSVPQLLNERLAKKEYRDTYLDLNGAAMPASKIFLEDPGADGIKAKREENQAFDSYEADGKRIMFNSDWKAQKISEQDYMKAFSAADERYTQILTALIAQLRKTS